MKIRKALDKAKRIRAEGRQTGGIFSVIDEIKHPVDRQTGNRLKRPPVYHRSIGVELDKQILLDNHCIGIEPDAAELDSYKLLRTRIQQAARERNWNTIMITSPRYGEGKTLTAVNLALTFSKAYNQTLLLVDCDLRHQKIRRVMGFKSEFGLIDYLLEDRPLDRLIVWPGVDKLTIISGGRTIMDTTELLGSPKMQALIGEMKCRYPDRYVILDVPAVLEGADALALMPHVDCIVMLVAEGKTSLRDVRKALDLIPAEKFLGFVLNRQKAAKNKKRPGSAALDERFT